MFYRINIDKEAFDHIINVQTAFVNYLEGKLPILEEKFPLAKNAVNHKEAVKSHQDFVDKYKRKKIEYAACPTFRLDDDMVLDFGMIAFSQKEYFQWAYEKNPEDLLLSEVHPYKSIQFLQKIIDDNNEYERKMMSKK